MKKAIIAGAASAVLAAMPVMGAFATGATTGSSVYTDTLILTIENACTFARGTTTNGHANGFGSWGDGTGDPTPTAGQAGHVDTLTATVLNGKIYDGVSGNEGALGTSTFVVNCNNKAGYDVTVATTGFTASVAANSTGAYAWGYSAGGTIANADNSSWTIASDHTGAALGTNKVAKAEAPVSDDGFTVTYKAAVDATQPADVYTASAEYTFAQL